MQVKYTVVFPLWDLRQEQGSDGWYCLAVLQEPLQLPRAVKASSQSTAFYT